MKTERADRQHSHEGQADSADRANWVGVECKSDRAGGETVRTKQADRQCRQDVTYAEQTDSVYRALKRAV